MDAFATVFRELFASLKRTLWQCRALIAAGSISLDCGTEPRQRGAQLFIFDRGQGFCDLGDDRGIRRGRWLWPSSPRQRRLAQRQPPDRAPAEEAVDPRKDHVG